MKRKSWTPQLLGAALAFVLSVSAVGNLATGFDLNIAVTAVVFLWCAIFSVVSAVVFRFKYGGLALLALSVLAAPLFWKEGLLWEQLMSIAYTISRHFHIVYSWPVLGEPVTGDVSLPLIVLGSLAAFSVSWCFCRHKSVLPVILPVIAPLVLCLVTTDTVPDPVYLYLVILGMTLLLMTGWTRRNLPDQGSRLTLRMALPIAAALAILFMANPREAYVKQTGQLQDRVVSWFRHSASMFDPGAGQKLNLSYVGPKGRDTRPVMRVNAPVDRTIYLRGRDYDVYSGTGWESSGDRPEVFTSGGSSAGQLSIVTYSVRDVLYVPYYTAQAVTMTDGALDNEEKLRRYSFDFSLETYNAVYSLDSRYTALPAETRRWANELDVIQIAASLPRSEKIRLIEEYVRDSAVYDLATPRMSAAYDDFAHWFLEESDTGYCVHFATAATVLLRAAGIPARYVEGYMVKADAGADVIVTNQNAHAWVEYFDSGVWRILEATPANMQAEEDPVPDPTPEETDPAPSESGTEPSQNETAPTPETQPLGQNNTSGATTKKPFKLPPWIFPMILAAVLIPVQRRIRIVFKRRQWNSGKPNGRAVARWKQTRRMARLAKEEFPESLEALAQKAVFSQHRIRDEELQLFDDYRESLLAAMRGSPWYRKILLRWIFAIDF